jgi:hypothetical protein
MYSGGRFEWVVIDHATVVIDNAPAGDAPSSNIVWVVANANDLLLFSMCVLYEFSVCFG